MMASAHPADQSNPFSGSRGSGAFYEPESSMEDHSTGADISPAAGDFFAKPVPEAESGAQSFQDLDISSPAPAAAEAAARFESKAVVSGEAGTPDLFVAVTNPTKRGDGMSAFFTYEVHTKTSLPQYQFGQFSVTRRFRDFDWLHAQLCAKFPGAIVPPLPEKHAAQVSTHRVVGVGCSAEFLGQRSSQLQRFLRRIAAHPQLHAAPDLQTFLEASVEALEAWKETSKQSSKGGYMSVFGDVKQGLLSSYTRSMSMLSTEAAPASATVSDAACQQMSNYAAALEAQISAVHRTSSRFIERHRAMHSSMRDFGASLEQLAACEADGDPSLSNPLQTMGACVTDISSLYDEQAAKGSDVFEEPMKEYVRTLGAAMQAIAAREASLRAYNHAVATLGLKRDRLEKLRSGGGKEDKVATAQREVQDAEEVHTCAKQQYEQVAARVDAEMLRFQREKVSDFKQMMNSFVSMQLEYSERVHHAWRDLLPKIEAGAAAAENAD